jgi:molybdenum cofactor cytidylyltransferase
VSGKDNSKVKSVAIILAAGSSSRLGQAKQLLKIEGETLLRKTVLTVIDSGVDRVVVVLGSRYQEHQKEISDLFVSTIINPNWENGMGSSLKVGIRFVEENFPNCETVILTVCDQPLLNADHLKKLIAIHPTNKTQIAASFYSGSPGVPALFHRSMFKKLLEINDEQGAKKIIKDNSELASFVDFPDGAIDLDTPGDWEKFNRSK